MWTKSTGLTVSTASKCVDEADFSRLEVLSGPGGSTINWAQKQTLRGWQNSWRDGSGGPISWYYHWTSSGQDTQETDYPCAGQTTFGAANWPDVTSGDGNGCDTIPPDPRLIAFERCEASIQVPNWDTGSYIAVDGPFAGSWIRETGHNSYSRSAATSVTFFAGGKEIPHRENLYSFNVTAQEVLNQRALPNFNPDELALISADEIAVGDLGRLGGDYYIHIALPDGATKDVTVSAPGPFYTFNIVPQKHDLRIYANGTDFETRTPEFCVGQRVQLDASWADPAPGMTKTDLKWTVSSDFINKIVPPVEDGCEQYLLDLSLLNNNPTSIWWYEGGTPYVWLHIETRFSNGQVASFGRQGRAQVYRPGLLDFNDAPPAYATNLLDNGTLWLELGDGNAHGDMEYRVSGTYRGIRQSRLYAAYQSRW